MYTIQNAGIFCSHGNILDSWMGRFLNTRAAARSESPAPYLPPPGRVAVAPGGLSTAVEPAPPSAPFSIPRIPEISPVQMVGLGALCIYLVSGYATDFSYRFLGAKPYVSTVAGIVVFLCFLTCGKGLDGLRTTVGKIWLALGGWMFLSVIFSRWRSGSFLLMEDYFPKQHMVPFYMAAFVVTMLHCRTLWRACIFGGGMLLLSCVFFSQPDDLGRLIIPTNAWLDNPNDLAMQLLLCMGFFLFLIYQPSWFGRIPGAAGMALAAYYILKTGSRGALVAGSGFLLVWMLFGKNRMTLMAAAIPVLALLVAITPRDTLRRMTLIFMDPEAQATVSEVDEKAIMSQVEREHLLKASIDYMLKNPLFGIGPGQFKDAIAEDGKKEGRHEDSLGPHNSYMQVGSECGIPGLLMFAAVILLTARASFRLYRATRKDPSQGLISALSFSCFVMTVSFGIDLFFHHMAYSGNLATVPGLWISLELAARRAGVLQPALTR